MPKKAESTATVNLDVSWEPGSVLSKNDVATFTVEAYVSADKQAELNRIREELLGIGWVKFEDVTGYRDCVKLKLNKRVAEKYVATRLSEILSEIQTSSHSEGAVR